MKNYLRGKGSRKIFSPEYGTLLNCNFKFESNMNPEIGLGRCYVAVVFFPPPLPSSSAFVEICLNFLFLYIQGRGKMLLDLMSCRHLISFKSISTANLDFCNPCQCIQFAHLLQYLTCICGVDKHQTMHSISKQFLAPQVALHLAPVVGSQFPNSIASRFASLFLEYGNQCSYLTYCLKDSALNYKRCSILHIIKE